MFASCTPTVEAELRDSLRADMAKFFRTGDSVTPERFTEYLRATSAEARANWRRALDLGAISRRLADDVAKALATLG